MMAFRITVQLLGVDDQRFHFVRRMYHVQTGDLLCTAEQMVAHVDLNGSRACPFEPPVKEALDAVLAAHASMESPANVGRQMKTKS